mgnify:FL=1
MQNVVLSGGSFAYGDGKVFISIPKVASTSIYDTLFNKLKWGSHTHEKYLQAVKDNWEFWAVIRHPVDRWISGICQMYSRGVNKQSEYEEHRNRLMDKEGISWFIDSSPHDTHTTPQADYLKHVKGVRIVKFEDIDRLCGYLDIPEISIPHLNSNIESEYQRTAWVKVSKIIEEAPELGASICSMYADDLALWHTGVSQAKAK